ncbi:zinc-binding dehydrogenase [Novosphingobium nitrogenifigens]|uniref:zinc-binding dehydrogenase n=1 Tax=Novosphingobium nitrogenifigens TaxID=378548 RepID=UPI00035CC231|nr:zinc-binding dehydrogenase [Novosphingobium nitrogenifigens]
MVSGKQLVSTLEADGRLIVELREETLPEPKGHEVLIRVEAAPINPSDLALLFGPADLDNADYAPGRIVAPMPERAVRAMQGRLGQAMPVGNEGAGTVIAAGEVAQGLIGKRVAAVAGGMYAQYRIVDARACLVLPEGASAEQGAAAFVNPLTALSFVEAMRREGHKALVHTAAASNLGQMLARICKAEGIPLVNVVRSEAQVALLRGQGAEHVVNSSAPDFEVDLQDAIAATGATLGFDAVGGGKLAGQILHAMEQVASRGAAYSRYGSNVFKKVYIYGALDMGPTIVNRTFGFGWAIAGFLLTPFLQSIGEEAAERLRQRVRDELTTTFASSYKARVTLEQALTREAALAFNARATGSKYLIVPHG